MKLKINEVKLNLSLTTKFARKRKGMWKVRIEMLRSALADNDRIIATAEESVNTVATEEVSVAGEST